MRQALQEENKKNSRSGKTWCSRILSDFIFLTPSSLLFTKEIKKQLSTSPPHLETQASNDKPLMRVVIHNHLWSTSSTTESFSVWWPLVRSRPRIRHSEGPAAQQWVHTSVGCRNVRRSLCVPVCGCEQVLTKWRINCLCLCVYVWGIGVAFWCREHSVCACKPRVLYQCGRVLPNDSVYVQYTVVLLLQMHLHHCVRKLNIRPSVCAQLLLPPSLNGEKFIIIC